MDLLINLLIKVATFLEILHHILNSHLTVLIRYNECKSIVIW